MIEDGLFERFPYDAVYAVHGIPLGETGSFSIRSGALMAAADTWTAVFKGTGGHGAMPSMATDATLPAAQFISVLQTIISRNVPAIDEAVISEKRGLSPIFSKNVVCPLFSQGQMIAPNDLQLIRGGFWGIIRLCLPVQCRYRNLLVNSGTAVMNGNDI